MKFILIIIALIASISPPKVFCDEFDDLVPEDQTQTTEGAIPPQVDFTLEFELLPSVKIEEPYISLGKVSTCRGPQEQCLELASVDLGPTPMPGEKRKIARPDIQMILEKEMGDASAHVSLSGAQMIVIEPIFEETPRLEVTRLLQEALDKASDANIKFEALSTQLTKPLLKRPGDFSITFLELSQASPADLLGIVGNRKREALLVQGGTVVPFTFYANLKASRRVPTAIRSIDKGTVLSKDDFIMGWQPIGYRSNDVATKVSELAGMVCNRMIRQGEPVKLASLKKQELVKRGQMVKVGIVEGGINITGQAKAINGGGAGDQIKVVFAETKKVVTGLVKNDGSVEVSF